jgi:hypothetical protein
MIPRLSPRHLTPTKLINTFEQVNGLCPGFRRKHAKGICIAGTFESNGQGVRLSKAAVFRPGRVPVIGRFALAGETTVQRGFNAPMLLVALAGHASGETTTSSDIIPRLSQAPGIATGIGRLVMSQHQFYELQFSVVCATTLIRLRHCPTKS